MQELRQRIGQTVLLNVVVDSPRPSGTFSIEATGSDGVILRRRVDGRVSTVRVPTEAPIIQRSPDRFSLSGAFDCYVDRTDGDPNLVILENVSPNFMDYRGLFPTVIL